MKSRHGEPRTLAARALTQNPADVTLKRAAWAYGCAKKGAAEEHHLFDLLCVVLVRQGWTPPPAPRPSEAPTPEREP